MDRAVAPDEQDAEAGQRLPAPAGRRPVAVRTVHHFDRDAESSRIRARRSHPRLGASVRPRPRDARTYPAPPAGLRVATQHSAAPRPPRRRRRRPGACARSTAQQHAVAPDDHRPLMKEGSRRRSNGTMSTRRIPRTDPAARARADSGTAPSGRMPPRPGSPSRISSGPSSRRTATRSARPR